MASLNFSEPLHYRRLMFWVLAFGYVLVFFHRLCPAVVATDMMADLHAGGTLIGFLSSAYFYPYALMQLPTGLLSDSWGPRKTITLFLAAACIGSILLGLAPSPSWAIVGRVLAGLGVSTLFVCTLKILAEWYGLREFVTMTGILMAMGGIGSLSAATPMAIVSSWLGWRLSFILIGLLTAVIAILIWRIVRDRPAELGWPSPAEHATENEPPTRLSVGIKQVLSLPAFWPLALWFFFTYGIFTSFAGLWGGPYLMQVYGVTKSQTGGILSLVAIGMIIGSPLVGHLSNHVFKGRKPTLVFASMLMVGITSLLAFATGDLSLPVIGALCFGLGIFASAIVVIGFTNARELFPARIAGTALGLVNLFPFAGGAFLQPLLGSILESHEKSALEFSLVGYQNAFFVLFLAALAALAASIFVKETYRQGLSAAKSGETGSNGQ